MSTWDEEDPAATTITDLLQVVCFQVGAALYALDILRTREVVHPAPLVALPHAPPFVEGLAPLRGAFLPVIDLRKRLGVPVTPATRDTRYVVVMLHGQKTGLVVDRVLDVRRVARADIRPVPALAVSTEARCLSGVVSSEGTTVLLLDLDAVLSPAERDLFVIHA